MGDFNPGGAINALAAISKAADKLPSPQGTPATTQQRLAPASAPKPVASAPRDAQRPVARPGVHPEDRSAKWPSSDPGRPTKGPLATRSASPNDAAYATSGIEQAMGALADRLHKPVHKHGDKARRR